MRTRPYSDPPASFDLDFKPFNADVSDRIVATTLQDGESLKALSSVDILDPMNTAAIAHKFELEQAS